MTKLLELPPRQTHSLENLRMFSLLFVGIFMLSLAAILIRLSERYIGPNATVFNRFWIATSILGVWRIASQLSKESSIPTNTYTISDIILLILSAIATSISHISWVWSLTQTTVSNANLLHNLTPIFATLGGWLLLNHNFDRKFLVGMLLTIGGAIAIGVQDFQIATEQLTGDTLALFSAVFYAANLLVMEKLRDNFTATSILLWSCFLRMLFTFPIAFLTEDLLFPSSFEGWIPVFCLALFCQVIGSGILAHNLKRFSSSFISLFLLLEPILTTILAWMIFSERLSILRLSTFCIVLLGIYLAKSGQGAEKGKSVIVVENIATESLKKSRK